MCTVMSCGKLSADRESRGTKWGNTWLSTSNALLIMNRNVKSLLSIAVSFIILLPNARGDDSSDRVASEIWHAAYLAVEEATELQAKDQRVEADIHYIVAEILYQGITREFPGFQAKVVPIKLEFVRERISDFRTARGEIGDKPDIVIAVPDLRSSRPGFYKDLFMDGGVNLASRKDLPAADNLGLAYEYYAGEDPEDQRRIIGGDTFDLNGTLLYPDGAPRFRMIYVNGGQATKHGLSLGEVARERYRQHNRAGGAYCGTCAGAFFSCLNTNDNEGAREGYLHIFPYNTISTGISRQRVSQVLSSDSPLLRYRNFGGDQLVTDVFHNGGNWIPLDMAASFPSVEVLATYSVPGHEIDKGAAIWSYRENVNKGRVVAIGSHPEGETNGEIRDLLEACFLYALDGMGKTKTKGILIPGETRFMNRSTTDGEPLHTKIGDGQVHYFDIIVPEETPNLNLEIKGKSGFDFHYYLNPEEIDFTVPTEFQDQQDGSVKSFSKKLRPGKWILAVECASRVKTEIREARDSTYFEVINNRELLNGVEYEITLDLR